MRRRDDGQRRNRGMALIDVLAALALLGLFAGVAGKLTVRVAGLQRDAHRAQFQSLEVEHALRELRRDVWSTSAVIRYGDGRLGLRSPSDTETVWRYDPEQDQLKRQWQDEVMVFPCPAAMEWWAADGGVTVEVAGVTIPMTSQILALQKGAP